MKNILFITPLYPQQRVIKYVTTLVSSGFNVTILTFDLDAKKSDIFKNKNYEVISLKLKGKQKLLPFKNILFRKVFNQLSEQKFDYILFRDIFTYNLAQKISMKNNSKLIMDLADNYPEVILARFKNPLIKKILYYFFNNLERIAVRKSSNIFVVTENSMNLILDKHNILRDKVKVIKNYPLLEDLEKKINHESIHKNNKLIYIGTVDETVRDLGLIISYIKNTNFKIDIYSFNKDVVLNIINKHSAHSNALYKTPVSRSELIDIVKYYSVGVIPHKIFEGTHYTVPNKLYDYIHSNTLVLASNNYALAKEIKSLGVGEIYFSRGDFLKKLDYLIGNPPELLNKLQLAKDKCIWEEQQNVIMEVLKR